MNQFKKIHTDDVTIEQLKWFSYKEEITPCLTFLTLPPSHTQLPILQYTELHP